ncbi:glutathione S-transferase [Altererythrobacter sp. B11]|uniref:glutathione S-transferase family protein n=1 Tax=Altererythrobacter sp. B11 TaxID=2060312 RepID=UPI000DC6F394|nr:glutathione S-transferase family protein [Altererythrobacter sp. B11]BBC71088.1 glutathione S-transferase [Altererythrobacter sp. B11]
MLELWHHGSSVCAAKVRLALAEKGVEWTGHYVDILAGEQFDPAFLAINPRGAVPAIRHEGAIITESTVICEYVDESFPGPALRASTPLGRARMRMWTKLVDEEVHPAVRPVTYVTTHRHAILARGEEAVEEHIASDPHPLWRERKRRWIREGFAAPDVADAVGVFQRLVRSMDAALEGQEWLAGESYTLADGALTPYANRLEMLGLEALWHDRPHFARWFAAVKARPSFGPALFAYLPDELRERMRADGRRAQPEFRRLLASLA